ncbi:sigma54 specific transcriptional regulator, Fis family [Thermocrinis albus DSM 14484]|uniref:Sigma54 specific transcriptional regulator, Fis family n=1 Tax=Thermocrinis albus (strain DSM 14484 / JCM 11386 / HI 11/12) TaxID=638303 RepID=D3SQC1_THEAH|nr:sigma-54-dependent Fis family transcriptional regulator [Thermocrinis albus]ADC89358.1 sigma54 specific transcriptional regulator, Fis family [Thermocrinis albus DSM 14484]
MKEKKGLNEIYYLFHNTISLIEHINANIYVKNRSADAFLIESIATVFEYFGYDNLLLFNENQGFYELVLYIKNGEIKQDKIRLDKKFFKGIDAFKSVQFFEYYSPICEFLSREGLIELRENVKVFIKTFHSSRKWIAILVSYKKFTSIPVYIDKMILDASFMFIEKLYKTHMEYSSEIDIYRTELENLAKFTAEVYTKDFIKYNDAFLEKIAKTDVNILIEGETGTGKSTLAYRIHNLSHRKDKPFKELFEAELFGYEKGAFTGASISKKGRLEIANGGTVFFDEIGDIPIEFQTKLLRLLQEKKFSKLGGLKDIYVDIRFIFATNKNLDKLVKEGLFRQDLYYRINTIRLKLLPFRDRTSKEKREIVDRIIEKLTKKYNKSLSIDNEVYKFIEEHHWPGNIRELENVLEYAAILSEDGVIKLNHLPQWVITEYIESKNTTDYVIETHKGHGLTFKDIKKLEMEAIIDALLTTNFNVSKAALKLGISRRQLEYRIKKYNIIEDITKKIRKNE